LGASAVPAVRVHTSSADAAATDALRPQQRKNTTERIGVATAWRLRHLPRSVLKEASIRDAIWIVRTPFDGRAAEWFGRAVTVGPAALFSDLALSGQINS
jgi:hypothetical protein